MELVKKITDIFFVGAAHPVGEQEDFEGVHFKESEILLYTESATTVLDLFYEHDYRLGSIGKIIYACVDDPGRLVISGFIDISSLFGFIAYREIKKPKKDDEKKIGMSVGIAYAKDENDKIIAKALFEVSLTNNPALTNTEIVFCAGIPLSLRDSPYGDG